MPYTTNRGFSVQAAGTNAGTWGTDGTTPTANSSNALNEGVISILDQALGGTTTLSLSSSNVNLTQLQAQNGMLRLTGTLLAQIVIVPAPGVLMTGMYAWENLTTGNFDIIFGNTTATVVLPQSRRGWVWIDPTNGARIIAMAGVNHADPIPYGTAMLFLQTAAPSGWQLVTSLNDYALKVSSVAGAVTSGSVAYSTVFGRTATDSHTLTTDQIPSHTHAVTPSSGSFILGTGSTVAVPTSTASWGSAASITSQATGGGSGHTHNIDLRVQTVSVIVASKI